LSAERLTLTSSAGFAAGAAEALPELIDRASSAADEATDNPLKDKLVSGADKCGLPFRAYLVTIEGREV
jgi:hypothetical protein